MVRLPLGHRGAQMTARAGLPGVEWHQVCWLAPSSDCTSSDCCLNASQAEGSEDEGDRDYRPAG
jgi:hypothetical protein